MGWSRRSLSRVASEYLLSAQLVDPASGERVRTYAKRVESEKGLLDAVDAMARDVRRDLGESLAAIQQSSRPLPKVTTPSLQALKLYADGIALWGKGDYHTAMRQYEAAVADDAEFAMAHAALGNVVHELHLQRPRQRPAAPRSRDRPGRPHDRARAPGHPDHARHQPGYAGAGRAPVSALPLPVPGRCADALQLRQHADAAGSVPRGGRRTVGGRARGADVRLGLREPGDLPEQRTPPRAGAGKLREGLRDRAFLETGRQPEPRVRVRPRRSRRPPEGPGGVRPGGRPAGRQGEGLAFDGAARRHGRALPARGRGVQGGRADQRGGQDRRQCRARPAAPRGHPRRDG